MNIHNFSTSLNLLAHIPDTIKMRATEIAQTLTPKERETLIKELQTANTDLATVQEEQEKVLQESDTFMKQAEKNFHRIDRKEMEDSERHVENKAAENALKNT